MLALELFRDTSHGLGLCRFGRPLVEMPVAQVILVVEEQFFPAGAGGSARLHLREHGLGAVGSVAAGLELDNALEIRLGELQ